MSATAQNTATRKAILRAFQDWLRDAQNIPGYELLLVVSGALEGAIADSEAAPERAYTVSREAIRELREVAIANSEPMPPPQDPYLKAKLSS